ncbi:TRAP transporter large permease [Petrocella sp. FN5]|uniref:TRAP transporter large permease n=1 Tax=Petrocella sp. FN5 TaxID=3032002 RepID=UPI0023DB9B37|nr:TRAP transporter large permease [Petrocella sp. FN5]MDF1616850.1 TRAP transporter large permease [Petrocella sp. FN5]
MIQILLVFACLILFILLGFPIYMSTIITGIIFVLAMDISPTLVIIKMFGSINSFALMAIPFFIIAGNIMMKAGITDKLVNFANAIVGQMKGGLGHVNIVTSMLFGGIQGSGAADASAIGGMLIPAMEKQGYEKDYAVAVTAASSLLSPIIPPSIAMILYSFYTEMSVGKLFLSGIIPGLTIGITMMIINALLYRKRGYKFELQKFNFKNLLVTFLDSFGALIMPLIIVLGIVFGVVTPTESGVLAIIYGLFYGFIVSRSLKLDMVPKILLESAITTSVVLMTISAAGIISNVFVRMNLQGEIVNFSVNVIGNPYIATFFLILIMMILGCFLDPTILIAMFATSILSVGTSLGFDPVHYGIIMIIVMQIGAITPPVGTFLFISCGIAGLPIEKSVKPLVPFILCVLVIVTIMIFVPGMATWIPSLIG